MRKRSIGYIGVFALAMAPFAMAQTPQPEATPEREPSTLQQETTEIRTVTGRVAEVDVDSLVVELTDGERMTFIVDRDLTQGPDPIRVGSQVRVEYRGERELQVVSVNPVPGTSGAAAEDLEPADDPDPDDLMEDDDNGATAARPQTPQPTSPAGTADPDDNDDNGELPGTASPLPLLLIAGISLLGGGVGLSARRRR